MQYSKGFLIFIILLFGLSAFAAETILDYDSNITVKADGALMVTETLQVQAEGNQIKRGIYRDFPTEYRLPNGTKVTSTFTVNRVRMNGGTVNWITEPLSNGTRVRIGSADHFLEPGIYTFEISYTSKRQLYHGDGIDELYWNVTGNGWAFPIEKVRANVLIPNGAVITATRAYTGYQGDKGSHWTVKHDNERHSLFETTSTLSPRQGLTISVTWPEGYITRPTTTQKMAFFIEENLGLLIAYFGFILIALYFYLIWKQHGKDPYMGPIIALYNAPSGLSPAAAGYIKTRGYRIAQFSAALVNMAFKGAIEIYQDQEKNESNFTLKKMDDTSALSPGEKIIFDVLFDSVNTIKTTRDNHKTFQLAQKKHESLLETTHENIHFIRNKKHFWIGAGFSILLAVIALAVGTSSQELPILSVPFMMALYMFLFLSLSKGLHFGASKIIGKVKITVMSIFLLVHFFGMVGSLMFNHFFMMVPFLLIFCVNILFFTLLEKPTIEGTQLLWEILGFEKYLSMAEKDRLEFHTGKITPEKFEEFLPFAIALGVENEWGTAFEAEMIKAGQDPAQYQPTGYHGVTTGVSGHSNLGSTLFVGAIASSVAAASASPSSSASSGSGGGGFSGGGGGGGGGGGW